MTSGRVVTTSGASTTERTLSSLRIARTAYGEKDVVVPRCPPKSGQALPTKARQERMRGSRHVQDA